MNRIRVLLSVLLLAWAPALTGAADLIREQPVVVDPTDLRTPVPDPEKELTEKYDGKVVVFTGALHGTGRDADTNRRWYKLAVQTREEQGKPPAKPKLQTVTVKVYFVGHERRLPTRAAYYTVQGTGEISVDGSLVIRAAKTVSVSAKKPQLAP